MRIISKFRDFYDAGMAEGQDRSLVFVRHAEQWGRPSREVVPEKLGPLLRLDQQVNPRHLHFTRPAASLAEVTVQFGLIWFAGRVYPFSGLKSRRVGQILDDAPHFYYTLDSLVAALAACACSLPGEKKGRGMRPRQSFKAFFDLAGADTLGRDAYEHQVAVASVFGEYVKLNGKLSEYEFFRQLTAFEAFQELSMFLGNIAAPDRVPVNVSDRDRIQQHGFDEWSFRKLPQKA